MTTKESSWKERKRGYGREHYKNLSKNEKNKLVEYRKKYFGMRKALYYNYKKYFSLEKKYKKFSVFRVCKLPHEI